MDSLTAFGQRVRDLRNSLGFSQEELAEKCSFDRTYISLVERGKRNPSYINILKISKGLGVSVSELTKGLE